MPGMFDSGLFRAGGSGGNNRAFGQSQGNADPGRPASPGNSAFGHAQGGQEDVAGSDPRLTGIANAMTHANANGLANGQPFQPGWMPGQQPTMGDVLRMGRPTTFPGQGGAFPGQGMPNWGGNAAIPGQGLGRPWGY
jgi:hypothetical protein